MAPGGAAGEQAPLDVLTTGRVGVDLYPEQAGPLETVTSFRRSLGGTATNVAVAAARLGDRSAVVTKVGLDPFGRYVRTALAGFGVDPSYVGIDPTLPTPLAFCALDPPDDPPLYFYRRPKAPDMALEVADLPRRQVEDGGVLWVTGSALSDEPSRTTVLTALGWRRRRAHTVLDLDFRPMFWPDPDQAAEWLQRVLPLTTVAVGNRVEMQVATGQEHPRAAAAALLAGGVGLAVVKLGGDGVLLASGEDCVVVPPVRVEVVCGLGAGDAFGGALCHGLLRGWDLPALGHFANAAGALVAGRLACADAMPTLAEIEEVLGTHVSGAGQ